MCGHMRWFFLCRLQVCEMRYFQHQTLFFAKITSHVWIPPQVFYTTFDKVFPVGMWGRGLKNHSAHFPYIEDYPAVPIQYGLPKRGRQFVVEVSLAKQILWVNFKCTVGYLSKPPFPWLLAYLSRKSPQLRRNHRQGTVPSTRNHRISVCQYILKQYAWW